MTSKRINEQKKTGVAGRFGELLKRPARSDAHLAGPQLSRAETISNLTAFLRDHDPAMKEFGDRILAASWSDSFKGAAFVRVTVEHDGSLAARAVHLDGTPSADAAKYLSRLGAEDAEQLRDRLDRHDASLEVDLTGSGVRAIGNENLPVSRATDAMRRLRDFDSPRWVQSATVTVRDGEVEVSDIVTGINLPNAAAFTAADEARVVAAVRGSLSASEREALGTEPVVLNTTY